MFRQTRIFVPRRAPFDTETWAETVVGTLIAPAVKEKPSFDSFWFSRYNCTKEADSNDCEISKIPDSFMDAKQQYRSLRFRFSREDSTAFEAKLGVAIERHGCCISDFREYTRTDLCDSRHIGGNPTDDQKKRRADVGTRLYQATSELLIDMLVGPDQDGRYSVEPNSVMPSHSSFEVFHHLFCNITNVPLLVQVDLGIRTVWMEPLKWEIGIPVRF